MRSMNWNGKEILKRDLQPYEPNKIGKFYKLGKGGRVSKRRESQGNANLS